MTATAAALERLGLAFETEELAGPISEYFYYDEDTATYLEGN